MINGDIVITWVDGADLALKAKRDSYLSKSEMPLHDNGTNPHRWRCNAELHYCLRSIANHADNVRKIWIVTDGQVPDFDDLPSDLCAKVSIVDHRDIFAGYEELLPTFNSLSIETFLWRIPGLSEHFVYLNDDVFLTSKVRLSDFFNEAGPVMRGKWADFSHLRDCSDSQQDASLLNHYNQIEAAILIGYNAEQMFASAHAVHPMKRSVMEALFDKHQERFIQNASFRFRCISQFLPQSLHNHYCIKNGLGHVMEQRDYIHVSPDNIVQLDAVNVTGYLNSPEWEKIKFLCINDLPQLEDKFPDAHMWIETAIGHRAMAGA